MELDYMWGKALARPVSGTLHSAEYIELFSTLERGLTRNGSSMEADYSVML